MFMLLLIGQAAFSGNLWAGEAIAETRIGEHVPRSAALSPDGKTLYLTGFFLGNQAPAQESRWVSWRQGVGRIAMETGETMDVFAGNFESGKDHGGSGPGEFKTPVSVDTDEQGRVYVADHYNDRIQIFDASGAHLKSISVHRPSEVSVDRRTGDIYVFSWYMSCIHFDGRLARLAVAKLDYHADARIRLKDVPDSVK